MRRMFSFLCTVGLTGAFGAAAFAQTAPVKPVDPTPQAGHVAPAKGEPTIVKELLPAWIGDGGIAGPGNDPCATPAVIAGASGSAATDTTTATNEPAESAGACGASATNADVWFAWTAPSTGSATFSFCTASGGARSYDTALEAYTGCQSGGGLRIICNDDFCDGLGSSITFPATGGTTYLIRVTGFSTARGTGTMVWNLVTGGGGNDDCANAQAISGPGTYGFDTTAAVTDGPAHASCLFFGQSQTFNDVWFCWTAQCDGEVTVNTCGLAGFDTKLVVYNGCTCPVDDARKVVCNDDFCGLQSQVTFIATAGNQYLIRVGSFSATGVGAGSILISDCTAPCIIECDPTKEIDEAAMEPNCGLPTDTVNGGCNSVPPVFTPINLGDRVCGNGAFDGATRDTDWFALTLTETREISWCVSAEFDVLVGIVENGGINDCAGVTAFRVFATAADCTEVCVTSILPPGTWWLFVAPQFLGTVPCQRLYNAQVTAPAPRGACCVGAGLGDCIITDAVDCLAQSGVYLGDDTNCAGGFTNEYSSGVVNVAIVDNMTSTSTLVVTDPNPIEAGELACGVLIQHTFQGDLRLTLTSPAGTTITLMDRPGQPEVGTFGYGNDDLGNPATGAKFYFVDGFARYDVGSAGVPVNQPTGNWGPDQPLATFVGEDKGGTWTLNVSDNAGGDVGAIIEWCIAKVGVGPCPPADPCANHLRGDANGDGVVNNFDIDAFVLAVVDPATYIATFCGGDPLCMICRCDINQDGVVNNFDIDPFVVCVVNGACP